MLLHHLHDGPPEQLEVLHRAHIEQVIHVGHEDLSASLGLVGLAEVNHQVLKEFLAAIYSLYQATDTDGQGIVLLHPSTRTPPTASPCMFLRLLLLHFLQGVGFWFLGGRCGG